MSKTTCVFLLLVTTMTRVLQADSITLTNGKIIQGVILDDSQEGIVIEFNVTPTIKDQQTFPRDQVASVQKVPEDEKDFVALGTLTSPKTVLTTSFYDGLIQKKIPSFLNMYPYSPHINEVRCALTSLEGERLRIQNGDRKIDEVWLSAAEISADPYQTTAKIKLAEIQQQASAKNPLEALQSCEILERDFPGTAVLPDAIDLGLAQLSLLQATLDKAKGDFMILSKRRQTALESAPADQVIELKNAIAAENQNTKSAMKAAVADGTKFFPVFPNNKEALDALQALITSEAARWTLLSKTPMRDSIIASKNCSTAVTQGDLKTAQEQQALSEKLWPANAENAKLKVLVEGLSKSQATATAQAVTLKAAADGKKN